MSVAVPAVSARRMTLALGALALTLASAGCATRSVDEGKETAKNLAVLRSILVFPGAVTMTTYSIGSRERNGWPEGGPNTSFTTWSAYRVPAGTPPAKVTRFYDKALRGRWTLRAYTSGGDRTFKRNSASLFISAGSETYLMAVDHDAYGG
jgi:hypothetical protein